MRACKAIFQVDAGVIPGDVDKTLSRRWSYHDDDYEADCDTPQDQETIFTKYVKEAHAYAMGITDPARVNWVRLEFFWV